jgi:hypothetical protein
VADFDLSLKPLVPPPDPRLAKQVPSPDLQLAKQPSPSDLRLGKQASVQSLSSDIQDFSSAHAPSRSVSPVDVLSTSSPLKPNGLLTFRQRLSPPPSALSQGALGRKPPIPSTPPPPSNKSIFAEELPALSSDDDKDMPDVTQLLAKDDAKRTAKRQEDDRQRMRELKLAHMQQPVALSDDEDDIVLEIADDPRTAIHEAEIERRRALPASHMQKQLGLSLGAARARRELASPEKRVPPSRDAIARAARPSFAVNTRATRKADAPLTQAVLDARMLRKAEEQNYKTRTAKEAEWQRRGGLLHGAMEDKREEASRTLAELAEMRAAKLAGDAMDEDGDEDEEEDEDYVPAGSGSEDEAEADENANPVADAELEYAPAADDAPQDDENEEPASPSVRPRPRPRPRVPTRKAARVVVDSDADSDAENTAASPDAELTDKENVKGALSEPGEDKENTAVVRAAPLFALTSTPKHSMSGGERSPFKELKSPEARDADNPFVDAPGLSLQPAAFIKPGGGGLFFDEEGGPENDAAPAPSLQPAAFIKAGAGAMVDFFDDEDGVESAEAPSPSLAPAAFLKPGGSAMVDFFDDEGGADAGSSQVPTPAFKGGLADAFDEGTQAPGPAGVAFGKLAHTFEPSQARLRLLRMVQFVLTCMCVGCDERGARLPPAGHVGLFDLPGRPDKGVSAGARGLGRAGEQIRPDLREGAGVHPRRRAPDATQEDAVLRQRRRVRPSPRVGHPVSQRAKPTAGT